MIMFETETIWWPINWYKFFMKSNANTNGVDVDQVLRELIIKERVKVLTEHTLKDQDLIELTIRLWNFVVKR